MFQYPQFIYLMPLALVLLTALYVNSRRKRLRRIRQLSNILASSGAGVDNHSITRSRLKVTLTILGLLMLFASLARPQFGYRWGEIQQTEQQILFVLDLSRSMLVQDVYPNRLERAKLVIRDIVEQHPSVKIGLLVFAESAFLQCPITEDHLTFLSTLELQQPGLLHHQGSNLTHALLLIPELLTNPRLDRVVLVSDGEDHSERLPSVIQLLRDRHIIVNTVCIGTTKGGLIPNTLNEAASPYFQDSRGSVVFSRANPSLLQNLAQSLGGKALHFDSESYSARSLSELILIDNEEQEAITRKQRIPVEHYQFPLLFAWLLLALEFAIGTRRTDATDIRANSPS
jgi:Ca-activated chloride channel homolog